MKEKYNLREKLVAADELLNGDLSIGGKGILTHPQYINSMRSIMFASHLNQFKNQLYPDFPGFFTGAENLVGKYSSGYKRMNHSRVFRKVVKFEGLVENPQTYKIFIYNYVKKRYEVMDRRECENLLEVFGFRYKNTVIDSFKEGDDVPEGTIPYSSTSYDEFGNYSYGRDIITMASLDPCTSEDACIASTELEEIVRYIESDNAIATLNDNDFPLNLYGGESGEYKVIPDVGECSDGIILGIRRKFNNQVLFDFKTDNLSRVIDTDTKYYLKGRVVDIDIFCNDEEFEDNSFYHQIYQYWEYQNKYYQEIIDVCQEIFDSGEDYSSDIDYLFKRANEMIDRKKRWRDKDSAFSKLQIHIHVERESGLTIGQKLAGRAGNKSVISQIRKKEDMPYYYDGNGNKVHVQLIISVLAFINRTTAAPLFELASNFIGKRVGEQMRKLNTMKEKESLLFDVLNMYNPDYCKYLKDIYKTLSTAEKKEFLSYCENTKIHLHQPSMHEKSPIFYRLGEIHEKYKDILKPDDIYIQKFGREIKCISPAYIAPMYIILLKQTAKKGFSVRGTGAVNSKGIPERSYKSKAHKDLYSSTAIRFGEAETLEIRCL